MTTSWYLTADHTVVDTNGEELIREARRIHGPADPTWRLLEWDSDGASYYEPMVLGGALSAVYWARKNRRAELRNFLESLGRALMGTGGRVAFLHHDERQGPLPELPQNMELRDLDAALESVGSGSFGWWELDLGVVAFLFKAVAARPFAPVAEQGAGPANGSTSDYRVTARCARRAVEVLREGLAEEGAWISSVPVPIVLGSASSCDTFERVTERTLFT